MTKVYRVQVTEGYVGDMPPAPRYFDSMLRVREYMDTYREKHPEIGLGAELEFTVKRVERNGE